MANEYCRHLSNGFRFLDKKLSYQPCCWVPISPPINSIEELDQYRNDITAKVLADKEKYCQDCIRREASGSNESLRQKSFWQIPESSNDGEIVDLSIQIDTTCNAACVICGPHFSSLWRKEISRYSLLENTEDTYTKLVKMSDFSKLRCIRFYGGEPLVNNNHLIILNAVPYPENVSLSYSTNGSIFPDAKVLDAWRKFKSVNIVFSLDDTDDRFHYIRWPLSWDKVKNNVQQFIEHDVISKVGINCTINPMNILYFDQLELWFNALTTHPEKIGKMEISTCYGTWGADAMPEKLRNAVIKKYGDEHRIVKLLNSVPPRPEKWEKLVAEMMQLDAKRKLSHQEVFSEVMSII